MKSNTETQRWKIASETPSVGSARKPEKVQSSQISSDYTGKPNPTPGESAKPEPEHAVSNDGASADMGGRIARRAYELYEQRGGEHGRALEDWLRAEAEIRRAGGGKKMLTI